MLAEARGQCIYVWTSGQARSPARTPDNSQTLAEYLRPQLRKVGIEVSEVDVFDRRLVYDGARHRLVHAEGRVAAVDLLRDALLLFELAYWNLTIQNAMVFPRSIIPALHAAAARFPIVLVLGARQVGKTTLARAAFETHRYLDLEDPRTAERFRQDARFELDANAGTGLILDEAQAVPAVFSALRGAVDAERTRPGRFIEIGRAHV